MQVQEMTLRSDLETEQIHVKCTHASEIWIVGYLSHSYSMTENSGYVLYATKGRDAFYDLASTTPTDGAHLIFIVDGQYPGRLKINAGDLQRGKSFPLYCYHDPMIQQGEIRFMSQ